MPPVIASVATALKGLAGGLFTSGTFLGISTNSVLFKLGASVLLSYASQLLIGRPSAPELVRDLQQPTELPPYRFAYGATRLYGSWAPLRVKGEYIYGCLILNSRPSHSVDAILVDKRPVAMTGDRYDFAGAGWQGDDAPFDAGHLTVWIGLGDQTGPPATILSEAGDIFDATDGWTGLTVAWVRLKAGANEERANRWPRVPPELEFEGHWSKVWDPREAAQDPDDPDTWAWSDNQALCVLDALRQNPIDRYRETNLAVPTFEAGADVADEAVTLKAGGTEPRYRVAGVLVFRAGELLDQIAPLLAAGASDLARLGGRLAFVPGAWRASSFTATDILGPDFEFTRWLPARDLPTEINAEYVSPARNYERARLAPWPIPGALAADGGVGRATDLPLDMVTSATQAMRLRKIAGLRARLQKRWRGTLPPAAGNIVPGSVVTLDLPAPYDRMDGTYEVTSAAPALALDATEGVVFRVAVELRELAASVFAWVPADDEEDIVDEPFDATPSGVQAPGAVTALVGAPEGGFPFIRFDFDPSPSPSVFAYDWQYRVDGGDWVAQIALPVTQIDGDGDVFGVLTGITDGATYDIRVRAQADVNGRSAFSAWVTASGIAADFDAAMVFPTEWSSVNW